jgi:hypothetical protein
VAVRYEEGDATVRYEEGDLTPRYNLAKLAQDNVTLLTSLVAAVIFAIRCVAVSDRNIETASILLAQTSLGDAIRALLFSVARSLLLSLAFGLPLVAANLRYMWFDPKVLGLLAASATASAIASYFWGLSSISVLAATLGIPGAIWMYARFSAVLRQHGSRRLALSINLFWGLLIVLYLSAAIGPVLDKDNFWLPEERLVFQGSASKDTTTFTGYVLKEDEDQLVILNDNPRIIIEMPKEALVGRDLCYPKYQYYEEALNELGRKATTCP